MHTDKSMRYKTLTTIPYPEMGAGEFDAECGACRGLLMPPAVSRACVVHSNTGGELEANFCTRTLRRLEGVESAT